MEFVFQISGAHKRRQQQLLVLQEQAERLGGSMSWEAYDFGGRGRQILASRFVAEIRFPHEAISGAAMLVAELSGKRCGLRIDTIFGEPTTMFYRSPALGRLECVPPSSAPRSGRRARPAPGVYSEDSGVLVAAIAKYL
jgi:hypothetical protein